MSEKKKIEIGENLGCVLVLIAFMILFGFAAWLEQARPSPEIRDDRAETPR